MFQPRALRRRHVAGKSRGRPAGRRASRRTWKLTIISALDWPSRCTPAGRPVRRFRAQSRRRAGVERSAGGSPRRDRAGSSKDDPTRCLLSEATPHRRHAHRRRHARNLSTDRNCPGQRHHIVLHEAPCSVLVARERPAESHLPRSIVVGVDGSDESARPRSRRTPCGATSRSDAPCGHPRGEGLRSRAVDPIAENVRFEDGKPGRHALSPLSARATSWSSEAGASTASAPSEA